VKIHVTLLAAIAAVLGPAVSGAALPPVLVPDDVRIAGVDVSGMRPDLARRLLLRRFNRPIRFADGEQRWSVPTSFLAGAAAFRLTVDRAVHAEPGARLRLPVAVQRKWVRNYVDVMARAFYRAPVDATLVGVRSLRPYIAPARYGMRVRKAVMVRRIIRNLRHQRRVPIQLATAPVEPTKFRRDFGQAAYPTPTGTFAIAVMQRWPTWTPPPSPWAADAKPIPPGPGNPLGTRWMGLNTPYVGIHGTPNAASIGYSASHGCIRMRIPDAEWLFDHATVGTPVFIVDA
jgi:hypothetical protein